MTEIRLMRPNHARSCIEALGGGESRLLNALPHDSLEDKIVVAFGIPFDVGMFAQHNNGVHEAPDAVRSLSYLYSQFMYPFDDIFEPGEVADAGNLTPADPNADPVSCLADLRQQIKARLKLGTFRPVFVGGDHTLPYATIGALSEHLGQPLAVIHLDAHTDICNSGKENYVDDSTFFYDCSKAGWIDPEKSVQLYLRQDIYTNENPGDVVDRVRMVDSFEMKRQFREDGFKQLVQEIAARAGQTPTFISLDIDAVDSAHAPGTTYPMPNGATSEELANLFLRLSETDIDFYGGEVVEVIPALDTPTKTTCVLAASLLRDFAILAANSAKRAGP